MNELSEPNLRLVVDEIALQVAELHEAEFEKLLLDKTMQYVSELGKQQPTLSESELDRAAAAIVAGVLKRLQQIAIGGGRVGSA